MEEEKEPVKIQSVDPMFYFVLMTAIKSIIGYVAIALFRPIWNWIVKLWQKFWCKD
jgi:hypothetical protein